MKTRTSTSSSNSTTGPRLEVPLTHDTGHIETQLMFSKSHGSTALLDALLLAIHEMRKSKKKKKALLVISDGGDNHSRYTTAEAQKVIRESDILIYAIGVFGGGSTPEEARRRRSPRAHCGKHRRAAVRGDPGRPARHRQEDRHRSAEPLCAGILAGEPAARWQVPSRRRSSGPPARSAEAERALAYGLLRADRIG